MIPGETLARNPRWRQRCLLLSMLGSLIVPYSFFYSLGSSMRRQSSSSWVWSMVDGDSFMTSRPELFLGKAITSRIVSSPARIETNRSNPSARPPCGGAPNLNAFIRKPNCSCARSGVKPRSSNMVS